MPALSEYSSVTNTAFNILDKKGYNIWYNNKLDMYCAEKDGWDFMADSPCGLLGVISIYEFKKPEKYQEYWWRDEDKDLLETLSDIPPEYTSVIYKK
ncbi:hypothetical protein [Xenorhabdus bovienii]|uniref:hypothetical protein n=1 Tax=Xenorhabdus bovienii TaxID=40576 RepID=UPI00237D1DCE|nr:hypothetical protein [Xenorhabdus bovienii]MDE1476617.1 hypothetical protein [Xenorhabdus bovienii]MDE9434250.1 hypothetical protein [Xenorhabdus bovienii]MDE9446522.1 hypothetical protein [Xenorhabdus bovienii]MDE9491884.1 hypothetical protein [Xenorhabdus bovienii]MDE9508260.1 hypothetical protein [Xenorhabdus bovienii]